MAKLILRKMEENPENDCAACDFAYWEGTPSQKELADAGGGRDGVTTPKRYDDEVSRRAGLERWLLSQSV